MRKMLSLFLLIVNFPVFASTPLMAVGKKGMVVSAQHLATQVGIDVLKQGGNAVDAAVAMGYALAVVDPCCGNIGGGGFMMIHLADGKNVVLNFREKAPLGLNAEALAKDPASPYATVGIPGTVKGLNAALKYYGTLPLKQLIQPAIALAEKGYVLNEQDEMWFDIVGIPSFQKEANVAEVFLKNGKFYSVGERLKQKALAKTLTLIGEQGDYAFYQGEIADKIAKASQENQGFITKRDLADYTVTFEEPLVCQYRGKSLLLTPLPSSGGIALCQLLKVLENFPLKNYRQYDSLENLKVNIEAIRQVYQDKARYIADPAFVKMPPIQTLLSASHAKEISDKIKKTLSSQPKPSLLSVENSEALDTTSYLVADSKGNIVAVTYTINGPFGARVMAGDTGFFLNNELEDFSYGKAALVYQKKLGANPNTPAPRKRPASSITQAILLENKKPVLVLATPGGDTIPVQILNTLENMIDYGKSVKESVNAPRYFYRWLQDKVYLEPELQFKKKALEGLGYKVASGSGCNDNGGLRYCGGMTAISIDPETRVYTGIVDKRRNGGMAEGY